MNFETPDRLQALPRTDMLGKTFTHYNRGGAVYTIVDFEFNCEEDEWAVVYTKPDSVVRFSRLQRNFFGEVFNGKGDTVPRFAAVPA